MSVIMNSAQQLQRFISQNQLRVMVEGLRGEEKMYFGNKLIELADVVNTMPKTAETDGQGDDAMVYLHYFHPAGDWYITEKDMGDGTDDDRQWQAFGYADMGFPELGYICIEELIQNNVELDLHWTPKTLREVKSNA